MRWMFTLTFFVLFCSCNERKKNTLVDYHFIPFYFGKIYLEKIPLNDESFSTIDSAEITIQTDHLSFHIPAQEEAVFQLRMNGKPLRIYFVNDVDHITIQGSSTDPKGYSFKNDGINRVLKKFIDQQQKISEQITPLAEKARITSSVTEQQQLMHQADSLKAIYEKNARSFADTTKSAGAFLFAFNGIDFGDDRKGLKEFITRAGQRFPDHKALQQLKRETMDYISIYEEELNVDDNLPALNLKNINGTEELVFMKGKYAFIDLWSTWCAPCLSYIPVKETAAKQFSGKLNMISIAVDAEQEVWQQIIKQEQVPGKHFIDEKMWRGKAAKTWKFDSIPFNYLVSPEGRILAKGIKPDSLIFVLNKFVK